MARFAIFCLAAVCATRVSPVAKVIELLDELTGKVRFSLVRISMNPSINEPVYQ